jgi:uncharacterized protein (UPF0335 family)
VPEEDYAENARESKGLAHVKNVGGIAGDRLRSFIERSESLEEEKRAASPMI